MQLLTVTLWSQRWLDAPVVDHVVALARGGEHGLGNWQTAYFYCNSVKRDQVMADVA